MEDRYLSYEESLQRLITEYHKYNSLFIAFDFDNTVFDFHKVGDTFTKVGDLLRNLKSIGCKLILFTGQENESLSEAWKYCVDNGYEPDFINCNPLMDTRKPYYNLLLDDRAGLKEAYDLGMDLLSNIMSKKTNKSI